MCFAGHAHVLLMLNRLQTHRKLKWGIPTLEEAAVLGSFKPGAEPKRKHVTLDRDVVVIALGTGTPIATSLVTRHFGRDGQIDTSEGAMEQALTRDAKVLRGIGSKLRTVVYINAMTEVTPTMEATMKDLVRTMRQHPAVVRFHWSAPTHMCPRTSEKYSRCTAT